eukprot:TRINITY_DN1557_c0_g1_i15.p1 TRINITY_DN1557_c0_g1~~TRINITY_DN1557_c0_g1_i15.p1  ORF type:complete len:327 (+),score=105.55 TRINITY_DN1557_c0_g1_i15:47-1027(+)
MKAAVALGVVLVLGTVVMKPKRDVAAMAQTDVKEAVSPVPSAAAGKKTAARGKPLCEGIDDFTPGAAVNITSDLNKVSYKWVPATCKLPWLPDSDVRQCIEQKRTAVVGDSIAMLHADSAHGNLGHLPVKKIADRSSLLPVGPIVTKLKKADPKLVVFSQGIWDIGLHWCGVRSFYNHVKAKLLAYRSVIGKDAWFIYHGIDNLNSTQPGWTSACNPRAKVELYREAIKLVTSCTDTVHLDTFAYSTARQYDTPDGVHYNNRVQLLKFHIMTHMVCRGLAPPKPAYACTPELEEELLSRWEKDPADATPDKECPWNSDRCDKQQAK